MAALVCAGEVGSLRRQPEPESQPSSLPALESSPFPFPSQRDESRGARLVLPRHLPTRPPRLAAQRRSTAPPWRRLVCRSNCHAPTTPCLLPRLRRLLPAQTCPSFRTPWGPKQEFIQLGGSRTSPAFGGGGVKCWGRWTCLWTCLGCGVWDR